MDFVQQEPEICNPYDCDPFLKIFLKKKLPPDIFKKVDQDLTQFSKQAIEDFIPLMEEANSNPPQHIAYTAWGKKVDQVKTCSAWTEFHNISAREGLIALGYDKSFSQYKRIYQLAKFYLFHPFSAFFTCPLAMTDGAVACLMDHGSDIIQKDFLEHLLSREPKVFWTSGQWMTEKTGGSDVSSITTFAYKHGDQYLLEGIKWFSSAVTADMALALAKIEGQDKASLFAIPLRDSEGNLQNIEVLRLKDKLGTKGMPTAELRLNKTPAFLVGEAQQGVRNISVVLNITRLYNSFGSISEARSILSLVYDYSKKRKAFGSLIGEQPLHKHTILQMEAALVACSHLSFYVAELLGKVETKQAKDSEKSLLRIFTTVTKLFTGKQALWIVSECLEAFGGAGYIEDTDIPRRLRDAQVFPIWEGTTNILSLDVFRIFSRDDKLLGYLDQEVARLLKDIPASLQNKLSEEWEVLKEFHISCPSSKREMNMRSFSFRLARLFSALLMGELVEVQKEQEKLLRTWLLYAPYPPLTTDL